MNLTEQRDQMLSGKMYNDLDNDLVTQREKTVLLTNKYNASFGLASEVREKFFGNCLKM